MNKILTLLLLVASPYVHAQCTYPTGNTQIGSTQTFCVRNPSEVTNINNVTTQRFILVNVIQGFTYNFSVGDVFTSNTENINVYNAADNSNLINNSGTTGANTGNWVSTISGQVKIVVSIDACLNNNTSQFSVRLELVAVGNTLDSQNTMGTNTWVGHVYNWLGSSPPPGGSTSPASPAFSYPFDSISYCGYYNVNSEAFAEGFGGDNNCFNVLSGGSVRTNVLTDIFAVRYRMRSTRPAGCYIARFKGDDGIRLYVDGVLVFSQWQQQGQTIYTNVLYYQDGDAELVFDFYEYQGGNVVEFSLTPFDSSLNTVTNPSNQTVCSGVTPQLLDGSSFLYNGLTINPTIAYQWQISDDNLTWANITGATSEDYVPVAITAPTSNIVKYYRRIISAVSNISNCSFPSNSVAITTTGSGVSSTAPTSTAATAIGCNNFTANWNFIGVASSYVLDVSTSSSFATFLPGYNALNVGNVNTYNVTGLTFATTYYYRIRAVYACGISNVSNRITAATLNTNTPTVTVSGISCNQFNISWTATTNTTSYIIDISNNSGFSSFITGYNGLNIGNITSYNVTDMTVTPVYVRVRAVGTCTTSGNSTVQTVNLNLTSWNGTTWSNGTPDLTKAAIINANYDTTTQPSIDACNIIVVSPFNVIVADSKYVNLQDYIKVNTGASFQVNHNGALVQINNNANNSGNISFKRDVNLRLLDYVYWSSPVANFSLTSVSPTSPTWAYFKWDPIIANSNGGQGNWIFANENMILGKGYIIRAPLSSSSTTPTLCNSTFIGTPNNGIITPLIQRGNYTGADYFGNNGTIITNLSDNFNLIGNPYPSAISAIDFLSANTNIEGAVRIWTHGTLPNNITSNPFYGTYAYNYTSNDYIVYNQTGTSSGPSVFNGFIAGGQSFMVIMNDGIASNEAVTFNNSMRRTGNNNQFFRLNDTTKKNIWLDIIPVNQTSSIDRILIGFNEQASDEQDRMFDAILKSDSKIYSLIGNKKFIINSKSIFDICQFQTLGIKINSNEIYKIGISDLIGFNNNEDIYLFDKLNNIYHNLRLSPYTFTSTLNEDNNRFEIRFKNTTLNSTLFDWNTIDVFSYKKDNGIVFETNQNLMSNIEIFDITGRMVYKNNSINSKSHYVTLKDKQVYIVKGSLVNGKKFELKTIN